MLFWKRLSFNDAIHVLTILFPISTISTLEQSCDEIGFQMAQRVVLFIYDPYVLFLYFIAHLKLTKPKGPKVTRRQHVARSRHFRQIPAFSEWKLWGIHVQVIILHSFVAGKLIKSRCSMILEIRITWDIYFRMLGKSGLLKGPFTQFITIHVFIFKPQCIQSNLC
jgi:hypothetical protein